MRKIQKASFIIFPWIFIIIGIICLTAGIVAGDRTLKIMGGAWIPMGILLFVVIMVALKKEK